MINPYIGLYYPLRPFVSICAKYFDSLDSKATDYFEVRLKFFIINVNSSYNND